MDFRLLGPLEVRTGDRSVSLGGRKQRSVLAVLLLHANEVVSADTLVDLVWGERPPPSATAYLHNCVSRLRKALGPDVLETHPPGYVLHASVEEIDARRFERALIASRPLEPGERAAALREGLSLWRGPPLADLAFEPFAASEIARLEELRLVALEERIEAELELGRHAELVPELEALVARYRSRERLRHAEMLALYRSRRKPDALQAFQEARLALIDELGLEPSEELRALERRIHADDPALELSTAPQGPEEEAAPETRRRVVVLYLEPEVEEQADPEATRRTTSACVAAVEAAVERHGGALRQLLGEEIVAFFGLPAAHEDDGLRALRAAVEARNELAALGAPARIALAAGAVVSKGGSSPVSGSAVREGRRLKERAAPGTILLSPSMLRLVGSAVDAVPADGTGDAFRLLRLEPGAPAVGRRFDSPLIGREPELARLQDAFAQTVKSRRCRRAVLVGEAGIGKSRLAQEFVASLEGRAQILTGRCVAYGEAARYLPLAEVLWQAVGRSDARTRIEQLLSQEADAEDIADDLTSLVDTALPTVPTPNVFRGVRRVLEALARKRPLVVVLEDLHWADATLLDLVEHLVAWAGEAPILVLCLARPELLDERPEWARGELALGPLGPEEAQAFVQAVAPETAVDRVELILAVGEGNPLFLEQLLAFGAEGRDELPPTLETLLASRLDRLTAPEREVVGLAAVVGRDFWRSAVEALASEEDRRSVTGRLISLVRQRLVRPAAASLAGEDGFVFHHALIRDAAYASLPRAARADLHRRLAGWLGDRSDVTDEVVGFHLEQAHAYTVEQGVDAPELARGAGERLGRAGMATWRRNDPRATVDLLSRAVTLLPAEDEWRLELACELATALKMSGDQRLVEEVLDETIALASLRQLGRIEQRARIERVWPLLMRGEADLAASVKFVEAAVEGTVDDADDRLLERAWFCLAALRGRLQCRHAASEEAAANALEHARRSGFPTSRYFSILAADAYYGPRPVEEAVPRCMELLTQTGDDRVAEADVRQWLACLEAMRGDFETARAQLATARALYEEFGVSGALVRDWALATTEVESLANNHSSLEPLLRDVCAALEQSGDGAWLATHGVALAEVVLGAGRSQEALGLLDRYTQAVQPGDLAAQAAWRRVRARALAHVGRTTEAERLARKAVRLLAPADELNEQAKCFLALAEVMRAATRPQDAADALAQAAQRLVAKGNRALLRHLHAQAEVGSA